jgi:exodeoxyribonuclease-3
MKIISWNVNGIRAIERKGAFDEIMKLDPDIFCVQETKAEREQLSEALANPDGYHSYFFSTEGRKGHSGTAIYSKTEPDKVEYGLPNGIDKQGRTITAYFGDMVVVTCYFPNGKSKTSPLDFKLSFYDTFLAHIEELKKDYNVIINGDFNVAHEAIDLARPKENENTIGFLPEERAWVDELIAHGWVDVWRTRNPHKTDVYSYWDQKTRARDRNVGWRIDYFFVQAPFMQRVKNIEILTDFLGSDHVPVVLEV